MGIIGVLEGGPDALDLAHIINISGPEKVEWISIGIPWDRWDRCFKLKRRGGKKTVLINIEKQPGHVGHLLKKEKQVVGMKGESAGPDKKRMWATSP